MITVDYMGGGGGEQQNIFCTSMKTCGHNFSLKVRKLMFCQDGTKTL